jgi:cell division protease FtsH
VIKVSRDEKESKLNVLNDVRCKLKSKYIGIDKQIDLLIDKIKMWYVYPEFLERPTIISLFGLTGIGKTSVVRDLVKHLKLADKYCEIEMSNVDSSKEYLSYNNSWRYKRNNRSISDNLMNAGIKPVDQSILLLDEIHKYRTIEWEKDSSYRCSYGVYEDIWRLLSDGNLYDKNTLISFLKNEIMRVKMEKRRRLDTEINDVSRMYNLSFEEQYGIMMGIPIDNSKQEQLKKENPNKHFPSHALNAVIATRFRTAQYNDFEIEPFLTFVKLTEEDRTEIRNMRLICFGQQEMYASIMGDIEKMSDKELLTTSSNEIVLYLFEKKLKELITDTDINESVYEDKKYVFSKMLIIIAGNLDNEDLYSENNVTLDMVKDELLKMFRPEEVSRFGKNFIIYPILSKNDVENIVRREINLKAEQLKNEYDKIDILDNDTKKKIFNDVIKYGIDNKQGVRPILTTVYNIMGEIIPELIIDKFYTLEDNNDN